MTIRGRIAAFGIALAIVVPPAKAGEFEDFILAYMRQDYGTASTLVRPLAEGGDTRAQYIFGAMYYLGQGVTHDYGEAAKWYQKAAEQGHTKAQISLGDMYYLNKGMAQDYVLAHMWYDLAAATGHDETVQKEAANKRDQLLIYMTSDQIAGAQRLAQDWLAVHAAE